MSVNFLHVLLSTSILATNVVPVTQPIPDIAIQVANGTVEEQATVDSNTDPAVQEESIDSAKEETGQVKEPVDQSEEKVSTNSDSRSIVTGTWGTSSWSFNDTSGRLTIQAGTLGGSADSPWNKGDVTAGDIKKIELVGDVVAPDNSDYLFSSDVSENRLLNLKAISGNLDVSQVTSMYSVFFDCSSLSELDVSNWDTSQVISLVNTFGNCSSLRELNVSNWDVSQVTSLYNTFNGCSSLSKLDVRNWDTNQVTSMYSAFSGCSSLSELDVRNWDTSQVTSFTYVFYGCSSLSKLDVRNWDTSQVTNFVYAFYGCSSLSELDVSNWDTGQVTNMYYAFYGCRSLSELDVSDWNTSQLISLCRAFFGCSSLSELDVSNWDVSQVTTLEGAFQSCSSLSELNVSNWDVSQVTSMERAFGDCNKLNNVDVSQWKVDQVITFKDMFISVNALASIDISSWNISPSANVQSMFYNCFSLKEIKVGTSMNFSGQDLGLPDNRWIGTNNLIRYATSQDFINHYDGSQPDTYVWDRTADLGLTIDTKDPMVIGTSDTLSWTISHTVQSTKGRTAKAIKGTISTAETIDLATEITVEEQDELGNFISMVNVPLVNEEAADEVTTYSYTLPDLVSGHQYKLSLQGTPWNNTTVSSSPTFNYALEYDANLEVENGSISVPDSLTIQNDRIIENGSLGFKDIPTALNFTTEKLSLDLNEQLIVREDSHWTIGISDYRGTKAQSISDATVARQDWELYATASSFKDTGGQTVAQDALGVAYVDEQNTVHELSESNETLLKMHQVDGETAKTDNYQTASWAEEKGLQAIVHNRNALEVDETYQADVTFELRSAP